MNPKYIKLIIFIILIIFLVLYSNLEKDNFKNKNVNDIIYEFKIGNGGIGDFIKYMRICKIDSEIKNTNFYINLDHPINNYLKIKDKYILKNKKKVEIKKPSYYYKFSDNPGVLMADTHKPVDFRPFDYFYLTEECKKRYNDLKIKNNIPDIYEGIHVRMGDSKMNISKNLTDDRIKNVDIFEKLNKLITSKKNTIFLIFSDNKNLKTRIEKKYKNVKFLDINILHTSYKFKSNQILDTLCDFLFLSNSKVIHSMTSSGFPIVASWMNETPLVIHYK